VRPRGSVYVAFSKAGRVRLVATTARTRGTRRVRRGTRLARLRRAYRHTRPLSRRLLAASRRSRLIFGVRGNRVRFVALADRGLRRHPRALARYLRLVGL
jgi:hypothetical protein